jgi:hypothetical protein
MLMIVRYNRDTEEDMLILVDFLGGFFEKNEQYQFNNQELAKH